MQLDAGLEQDGYVASGPARTAFTNLEKGQPKGHRMSNKSSSRNGGIINNGMISTEGGHVVGGNYTSHTELSWSSSDIRSTWQPVAEAVQTAPSEVRSEAVTKLEQLKEEVAKGDGAEDATIAKLIRGLVGLVPSAIKAVVTAFGTPVLASVAGPVTSFILTELGSGQNISL